MTRLVPLVCPGCQAAFTPGRMDHRVLCCRQCPTAVDLAHDGLQSYPVRVATGDGLPGLYWALAGDLIVNRFKASQPAVTPLGKVSHAGQTLPYSVTVPLHDIGLALAHADALRRVAKPLVVQAWTPEPGRKPPEGSVGRREAERIAHQVCVTLITRADGSVFHLDVSLRVTSCIVLRVD